MTPLRIRLLEALESANLSQKDLAEKAQVREATISAIARGKTKRIALDTLDRIAKALGVTPGELLETEPKRKR